MCLIKGVGFIITCINYDLNVNIFNIRMAEIQLKLTTCRVIFFLVDDERYFIIMISRPLGVIVHTTFSQVVVHFTTAIILPASIFCSGTGHDKRSTFNLSPNFQYIFRLRAFQWHLKVSSAVALACTLLHDDFSRSVYF